MSAVFSCKQVLRTMTRIYLCSIHACSLLLNFVVVVVVVVKGAIRNAQLMQECTCHTPFVTAFTNNTVIPL